MEGGKWGLVIIASAFMIQFLAFGATAAIGVYNIELLDYFHGAAVQVSLIGSLNFGMFLGSGPVVSFLMTKLSYRKIALFGSVLVVLGLLGMPLLPYIPAMCISFGLLTGFGSCCVYIPSHVLSGLYYDKYRSLATGVATSGSGLGGAIMPVLCGLLIEYYSWKGSLIFVAGLCLHLIVLSSLLREPPSQTVKEDSIENSSEKDGESQSLTKSLLQTQSTVCQNGVEKKTDGQDEMANGSLAGHNTDGLSDVDMESGDNVVREKQGHQDLQPGTGGHAANSRKINEEVKLLDGQSGRMSAASKFQSLSLSSLHSLGATRGSSHVVIDESVDKRSCGHQPSASPRDEGVRKVPNASRHIFIFTHYGFDIYFLSNIMWNAAASIVGSFAPEFLTEKGLSPMEAAWMSGALGFGVFVGGILGGLFGNFKKVNRQGLYTLSNLVMGFVLIIFPFVNHMAAYAVCLVVDGLAFGMVLGLLIIVLTDLIGVESLGNGLGYLMLSNGLGTFVGPPMAGALREQFGGFDAGIILAGILCLLGGVIMFLMPCQRVCRQRGELTLTEGEREEKA